MLLAAPVATLNQGLPAFHPLQPTPLCEGGCQADERRETSTVLCAELTRTLGACVELCAKLLPREGTPGPEGPQPCTWASSSGHGEVGTQNQITRRSAHQPAKSGDSASSAPEGQLLYGRLCSRSCPGGNPAQMLGERMKPGTYQCTRPSPRL